MVIIERPAIGLAGICIRFKFDLTVESVIVGIPRVKVFDSVCVKIGIIEIAYAPVLLSWQPPPPPPYRKLVDVAHQHYKFYILVVLIICNTPFYSFGLITPGAIGIVVNLGGHSTGWSSSARLLKALERFKFIDELIRCDDQQSLLCNTAGRNQQEKKQ